MESEMSIKDSPVSGLHFRFMALCYKARDLVAPPRGKLREAGVRRGQRVLDFGCGPGSYSVTAAELVGETGKVYALDVRPLACGSVKRAASRRGLTNVETICSDCATELQGGSVDIVLRYDVFHILSDPDAVLSELHRVLKPGGVLSFSDHHMREEAIVAKLTCAGLFGLSGRGRRTHSFSRR